MELEKEIVKVELRRIFSRDYDISEDVATRELRDDTRISEFDRKNGKDKGMGFAVNELSVIASIEERYGIKIDEKGGEVFDQGTFSQLVDYVMRRVEYVGYPKIATPD
jgi:hypothetical protein